MDLTLEELDQLEDPLVIDVRSPSEYAEDHLPGAVNLPVLDDDERDRIGTIYHQDSTFKARRDGAKAICRNVPDILDAIEERASRDRPLLVYCWRGGQRSQSLTVILERIGYDVHRLDGGYKAYRKRVHTFLTDRRWKTPVVTVFGLTGSGKTALLDRLSREGESVLDLEGAANHRGSAFGGVGRGPQPSQKAFERRLYQQLDGASPPIYTEGESRKIGRRTIPDELFDDVTDAPSVWLETPIETRVENIRKDYPWPECREELIEGIGELTERLGKDIAADLQEKLRHNQLDVVIRRLLEEYYDPAYRKSSPDPDSFDTIIEGDNLEAAARCLIDDPEPEKTKAE